MRLCMCAEREETRTYRVFLVYSQSFMSWDAHKSFSQGYYVLCGSEGRHMRLEDKKALHITKHIRMSSHRTNVNGDPSSPSSSPPPDRGKLRLAFISPLHQRRMKGNASNITGQNNAGNSDINIHPPPCYKDTHASMHSTASTTTYPRA